MKKILPVAVMTALAGINAHAAVNINNDGTGQVLLYPFYTTEGGQDTYINVVNTTNEIKAVKVRVLESMNSVEVLDFNLYLSPEDHWSAVITADPAGEGAMMVSADNSCTVPNAMGQGTPIPFRNFEYALDTLDNSLARTKEGYVEIIEMGVVDEGTFGPIPTGEDAPLDTLDKLLTFAITHTAAGVPGSCAVLEGLWLSPDAWGGAPFLGMIAPTGGLYGYGVLIDVAEGTDATYDATALDGFSDIQLHTAPGLVAPSLGDGTDEYIVVNEGALVSGTAATGLDAVSATMMVANIANDYVLEPTISAGTDWVITFPTKNAYVNGQTAVAPAVAARAPFTSPWTGAVKPPGTPAPSCEAIGLNYWDREEQGVTPGGLDFSPPPPVAQNFALCAEANVLTFNSSNVLKASSRSGADLAVIHDNGWARIDFTVAAFGVAPVPALAEGTARKLVTDGATFDGLPALGFAVQKYVNGDVGGVLSNYAGSVTHKGTRVIGSGTLPD